MMVSAATGSSASQASRPAGHGSGSPPASPRAGDSGRLRPLSRGWWAGRTAGDSRWALIAPAAALSFASWLYLGYRYLVYPQTGFFDWVFRIRGDFTNDFHTSLPPIHWVFAEFLALLPNWALAPTVFLLWAIGLVVLWGAFISIARSAGASTVAGFAAGLVLVPTSLGGFGLVTMLLGLAYPTAISFAFALASIAALLRSRFVLAGAMLGIATLVHPNLGVLAAVAIAPMLIYVGRGQLRRSLIEFGVPCALIAAISVYHLLVDLVPGAELSPHQRFDLLTDVRAPHHYLYSAFTETEYIWTAAWGAVLAVSLVWLRQLREARAIAICTATVLVMCGLGAIASVSGGPLFLVSAQTARLSPLFVVFGAALASAILYRAHRAWGPAGFVAIFLAAPPINSQLQIHSAWYTENGSIELLSAVGVLALLGAIPIVSWTVHRWQPAQSVGRAPAGQAALLALVVASAVSLGLKHHDRTSGDNPKTDAFVQVAEQARAHSSPKSLFLSPPDEDGFRTFAHRGTVVEFGTIEFSKGDVEWVRRMLDVTRDPMSISPDLPGEVPERVARIERDYQHTIATSSEPICRYHVNEVVVGAAVRLPPWLQLIYKNTYFQLLRVRPGTCPSSRPS